MKVKFIETKRIVIPVMSLSIILSGCANGQRNIPVANIEEIPEVTVEPAAVPDAATEPEPTPESTLEPDETEQPEGDQAPEEGQHIEEADGSDLLANGIIDNGDGTITYSEEFISVLSSYTFFEGADPETIIEFLEKQEMNKPGTERLTAKFYRRNR